MLQKAGAAIGISSDDLSGVLKLQNFLHANGFADEEIAAAFAEVLAAKEDSSSGIKVLAKQMLAALDHPRIREADLLAGTQIAKAFDFVAVNVPFANKVKNVIRLACSTLTLALSTYLDQTKSDLK